MLTQVQEVLQPTILQGAPFPSALEGKTMLLHYFPQTQALYKAFRKVVGRTPLPACT